MTAFSLSGQVALVTGAEFLQSKLTPAVPADLTDAAQKFSNTLLDIGAAASVGTMNDDPEQANVAAAEGRALLQIDDRLGARAALTRAIRVNPFIPSLHCDLARLSNDPDERSREQAQCRE